MCKLAHFILHMFNLPIWLFLVQLDLSKSKGAGAKLEKLAVLQEPVDHFFDEVMVMAEDEKVRKNRLGLLRKLRQQFLEVADFSLLQ